MDGQARSIACSQRSGEIASVPYGAGRERRRQRGLPGHPPFHLHETVLLILPVGVRNSDQVLDLRLRNATAQTCQRLLGATDAGMRASVPLRWGRTAFGGMAATRPDLSASDSGLSTFGSRAGRAGPRAGAIAYLWSAATRTTPQVIRVVGSSCPRGVEGGPVVRRRSVDGQAASGGPERHTGSGAQAELPARPLHPARCAPITT